MTSPEHESGTDRVAEVAGRLGRKVSHIINVQGDEPAIAPALIDRLADTLRQHRKLPMVTAANVITDAAELASPHCVKVTLTQDGDALYFSRSVIPYPLSAAVPEIVYYRHQGIYGYARRFLAEFVRWKPSVYEKAERLEQLRALEHGAKIRVLITEHPSLGVDVPGDVESAEQTLSAQHLSA